MSESATETPRRQRSPLRRWATAILLGFLTLSLVLYAFFFRDRQRNLILAAIQQRGGYIQRDPRGQINETWLNLREAVTQDYDYRYTANFGTVTGILEADLLPHELPVLSQLPELDCLHLKNTPFSPELCTQLARLPNLDTFTLQNPSLTNAQLHDICQSLSPSQICVLCFWDTPIDAAGLRELTRFTRITNIGLHGKPITAEALKTLAPLKSLRNLSLPNLNATKEHLAVIARQWPELITLYLRHATLTEDALTALQAGQVIWLYLDEVPITDAIAQQISQLPSLANLSLQKDALSEKQLASISTLFLRSLNLHDAILNDQAALHLNRIATLETLDLRNVPLTDAAFSRNHKWTALQNIQLNGTEISDPAVSCLLTCPALEWLNMERTNITDATLELLQDPTRLPKLKTIGIRKTKVTAPGVKALKRKRPKLQIYNDFTNY